MNAKKANRLRRALARARAELDGARRPLVCEVMLVTIERLHASPSRRKMRPFREGDDSAEVDLGWAVGHAYHALDARSK